MIVQTKDGSLVVNDAEAQMYSAVRRETELAYERAQIKAKFDERVNAAVKQIESDMAGELARSRELAAQLAIVTPEVDTLVMKAFADTGVKTYFGGMVKLQERKRLPDYDRSPGSDGKSVWEWIKDKYPGFFQPNWQVFEKFALANQDATCPIKPIETPVPLTRDSAKIAAQWLLDGGNDVQP